MGYFPYEFKKGKPPTFDGDLKKLEKEKYQTLGMKHFFELNEYQNNMKAVIYIFILRVKADIYLEYVKWVRRIKTCDLSRREFKRLFRKKHLSYRYYDNKEKDLYELIMGSMRDEEYMTNFLGILRYVPYLTYDKAKVEQFLNGFPSTFKDPIEYDDPQILEEVTGKLNHCYE